MFFHNKKAFSYGEVVVAIIVLAFIAAITVPAFFDNTMRMEHVAGLKKAYSILSQATEKIFVFEGSPLSNGTSKNWIQSNTALRDIYRQYLEIQDYLPTLMECDSIGGNCKPIITHKNIDGSNSLYSLIVGHSVLVLQDGIIVSFDVFPKCDENSTSAQTGDSNVCAYLYVDVNGVKAPNKWGRDSFRFYLSDDGLSATGINSNNSGCRRVLGGMGCTYRALTDGREDY